jgi:hypothetical protein
MVMDGKMFFSQDDWNNKLSQAQKSKFIELKKAKPNHTSCNHAPKSTYNMHSKQTHTTPTPTTTSSNPTNSGNSIRHLLSTHNLAQQSPSLSCIPFVNMNPQLHEEL